MSQELGKLSFGVLKNRAHWRKGFNFLHGFGWCVRNFYGCVEGLGGEGGVWLSRTVFFSHWSTT